MPLRQILVFSMTILLAYSPAPARSSVLGVVIEAERAHVHTTAVTAGATIYDGDRYSTDERGAQLLRAGTSMLELGVAIVGGSAGAAVGIYESRSHRHKESPDRP